MGDPPRARLTPLREAVFAEAEAEAVRIVTEAQAGAAARVAEARGEAAALLADAERAGAAEGSAAASRALADARREGKAAVLAAERESYEELRRRAHDSAAVLLQSPGRATLARALGDIARRRLAVDGVELTEVRDGGVVAHRGPRSVDYSLHAVVERALDARAAELGAAWGDR